MRRPLLALVASLILAPGTLLAGPGRDFLWRTDPAHQAPPLSMPYEPAVAPPLVLPQEWPASILVRRTGDKMEKLGKLDRRLSEACQRGLFKEVKASKMIAVTKDATLGAAFGHGLGLADPKKLGDPSKVYYFYHASTPLCMVRVEDNWDPAHSRSR